MKVFTKKRRNSHLKKEPIVIIDYYFLLLIIDPKGLHYREKKKSGYSLLCGSFLTLLILLLYRPAFTAESPGAGQYG